MISAAEGGGEFRAGLARGELLVTACAGCGEVLDYSIRMCPACGSGEIGWSRASGRGRLRCAVEMSIPYSVEAPAASVIASVELAEGPHLLANYEGDLESAYAGRQVVAEFSAGKLRFRAAG